MNLVCAKLINNDLVFDDNGNLVLINNEESAMQVIKTELENQIGDYIYNITYGVNWINGSTSILGNKFDYTNMYSGISAVINKYDFIDSITSIVAKEDTESRTVIIDIDVKTTFGDLKIEINK